MPRLKVAFDARELKHLQGILNRGGLAVHQRPMQDLFRDGSRLIFTEARKRSPLGRSGATLSSIADVYGNTGKSPWGIGRVAMTTKQGVILNNGGRGGKARHRLGPRAGQKTKGWFSGTIRLAAVKRGIDDLARRAAGEMGRRWSSGR